MNSVHKEHSYAGLTTVYIECMPIQTAPIPTVELSRFILFCVAGLFSVNVS